MVTWSPERAPGSCPAGRFARAGLRWCGGWRRINLGESRDKAQIQAEGGDPLNRPKDPQSRIPGKIGARFVQISATDRYETQPNCCDASDARRGDDCRHHDRDGLAATFRSRLSCWSRPQETWAQPRFRTDRPGSRLSHQGSQSVARCCRPDQTDGLMLCRRNIPMVAPRPKCLSNTRSRICAVSISKGFVHAGTAYFNARRLLI